MFSMLKGKKKILLAVAVMMVGSIGLVGCSKSSNDSVESKDKMSITLVLDKGGVNDTSFNQSAWEGALEAQKKYDVEIKYLESQQESDYTANIETAVEQGADLVIGVGYNLANAIEKAAGFYPEQNFAIIDGSYENTPANVRSILFNEEEAGYAVGLLAGKLTETDKIGFVGGFDIPSVTSFLVGYEKAAKEVNPNITVVSQYANSFSDAALGKSIAQLMENKGVDIIMTAGGGVNTGVYELAREKGIKAIGVDMPSNHIAPDTIISSALKNVGTGVELTIKDLVEGNFKGGEAKVYDLSNGGVGYEKTGHISKELQEFLDEKLNK